MTPTTGAALWFGVAIAQGLLVAAGVALVAWIYKIGAKVAVIEAKQREGFARLATCVSKEACGMMSDSRRREVDALDRRLQRIEDKIDGLLELKIVLDLHTEVLRRSGMVDG